MKTLLQESTLRPTKCKELISGWPDYIGVKDASVHYVGGIVFGENFPCTPTAFRMQWTEWVKKETISGSNRMGTLTNSNLKMDGFFTIDFDGKGVRG